MTKPPPTPSWAFRADNDFQATAPEHRTPDQQASEYIAQVGIERAQQQMNNEAEAKAEFIVLHPHCADLEPAEAHQLFLNWQAQRAIIQ